MAEAFPTEVWRLSWINASSRDLKTLSSSCRLFRDICQPLFFQNLSYISPFLLGIASGNRQTADTVEITRSRDRLLSIASSAYIPPMVHSWAFRSPTALFDLLETTGHMQNLPPVMKQIRELSLANDSIFRSAIGLYTNLSELTLTGFHLSPDFSQTLTSLPKLATMCLTDCDIVCPISRGGIALEEFMCSNVGLEWQDDIAENYYLVSTSKLQQLQLADPVVARTFLTVFTTSGPLPNLVYLKLSLDYDAKEVFYRFLDCCPELKCIDLEAPATFGGVSLPETSIPMLCSFTGPIEIAGVFTGGRPVRSFKVHRWGEADDENEEDDEPIDTAVLQQTLLEISQSGGTLAELSLPLVPLESSPLCLISDPALFPKLKRLMFFLLDTRSVPSEEPHTDEGSEGGWETVGGSSGVGSDDEIIDFSEHDAQDSEVSTGWMPLNSLLNMEGAQRETMLEIEDEGEHHCEDCDCTSDTSADTDGPEDEAAVKQKVYEDLKLDSYEDFILSLGNDSIPLPRHIRTLCVGQVPVSMHFKEKSMPDADVSSVVEKLGARYPKLNKVTVGFPYRVWKRKGGVWKPPKPQRPMPSHDHPLRLMFGSLPA
ncbi:hypothetical protein B0H19DRAFT_1269989 [Mycena capillaripes]|nr:hypothetical protein B0H19DRAFT_1269989 [Mycena capillaripes]